MGQYFQEWPTVGVPVLIMARLLPALENFIRVPMCLLYISFRNFWTGQTRFSSMIHCCMTPKKLLFVIIGVRGSVCLGIAVFIIHLVRCTILNLIVAYCVHATAWQMQHMWFIDILFVLGRKFICAGNYYLLWRGRIGKEFMAQQLYYCIENWSRKLYLQDRQYEHTCGYLFGPDATSQCLSNLTLQTRAEIFSEYTRPGKVILFNVSPG